MLGAPIICAPAARLADEGAKDENNDCRTPDGDSRDSDAPRTFRKNLLDKADACRFAVRSESSVRVEEATAWDDGLPKGKDFSGPWGAPAMYALEGASVGLQIGEKLPTS